MVNFFPGFVVPEAAQRSVNRMEYENKLKESLGALKLTAAMNAWDLQHPMERGSIYDVVDHIDHIVQVAGIDHVGIGSDFDGVSTLPRQLEDVSKFPLITQELLNRGYNEDQILKILGGNLMRAMRQAEQVARQLSAGSNSASTTR
jgi:membrane dipeptidase